MTQLEYAKRNIVSRLMKQIASIEAVKPQFILSRIKDGSVVIPNNSNRFVKKPCGIGKGLRVKINANIGTSPDNSNLNEEIKKLNTAVKYGADTVMDLSIGANLGKIRKTILDKSPIPVGTVPIYEIAANAREKKNDFLKFDITEILDSLEAQAKAGVDFFTIHAGVTRNNLAKLKERKRYLGVVSRGGAILSCWMNRYRRENPFFEHFDRILDIASKYDVTLSLGDGLRPGSILDANDNAQFAELKVLGELARRSRRKNVQVIIEGPGHVPLNKIRENILLEKKLCAGAPFYVLGPLVTDIASGYDHINASIGAALAASYGADFLCFVTGSEHLRLPSVEDVKQGVIASKIAAHAADITKNIPSAIEWDKQMSMARRKRDWKKQIKLSIDPERAAYLRTMSKPPKDVCTMCGDYCSIKLTDS